jgi:peroxiredoxin Q/BCP
MSKKIQVGDRAPDFSLPDRDNNVVSLAKLTGNYKVVYFYPKDDTPGCTIQAKQFSKDLSKLSKLKVAVVGISGGDSKTKTKFCSKHKITVPLLSDTDFSVSKRYQVFGEKVFMGRKYLGISRVTFLLDKNGTVLKIWEKASPEDNSQEIIDAVTGSGSMKTDKKSANATKPKKKAAKASPKATAKKSGAEKKTAVKTRVARGKSAKK